MANDKIGAVMVVGGGIAGMQASLDAAAAGFKVYLVERDISIGGVMAQLDKTFPTNDCSTCLISPKLIEVARHPDIEILTQAEVENLSGDAGHFTVTLETGATLHRRLQVQRLRRLLRGLPGEPAVHF